MLAATGRHRDHGARTERQLLRSRHHPSPPALRGPAARPRRGGGHRAHPLHQSAPQGPVAPRPSPPWPRRRRSVRSCTCRCSPVRTGCSTAMRRGYRVERYLGASEPRPARRSPTSRSRPISSWAFPARATRSSTRRSTSWPACEFDSPTRSSSLRVKGTRAAEMTTQFVPERRHQSPLRTPEGVSLDRSALRKHEARVGRREEVLVEGPSRRNDLMLSGRTRQGKLIHFPALDESLRAGSLVRSTSPTARPTTCSASMRRRCCPAPRHKVRVPLLRR